MEEFLLSRHHSTAQELEQLLGWLGHAVMAIPMARHFLEWLHGAHVLQQNERGVA